MAEVIDFVKLVGVAVVNTQRGNLARNMTASLTKNVIQSIKLSRQEDSDAHAIDGRGNYLVPGYVDMHAHVLEDECPQDALELMLAHGVTGWRQMSGSSQLLSRRKGGMLRLGKKAPELLAMPGQILTMTNADTPEQARAAGKRQKEEGADSIKTIHLDPKTFFAALGEATRQGLAYVGHLSPGVNARKAARAGMRSIEHLDPTDLQLISCSKSEWLIRASQLLHRTAPSAEQLTERLRTATANPIAFRLQNDASALQKTQRLLDSFSRQKAESLAALMAHTGTWRVPTLIRNDTMQCGDDPCSTESPALRYTQKPKRDLWASIAAQFASLVDGPSCKTLGQEMNVELDLVHLFYEAGVPMLTSTDYGGAFVVPGVALHQEFELLERAGLDALRVLQMAHLNAALFLGRQAEMGAVEVWKVTDLLLVERNPLEAVANLHAIDGVIRGGTYYSRQALEAMKKEVARRVVAELVEVAAC